MGSAVPTALPIDEPTAEAVGRAFKLDGFFPEFNAALCAKVFPRSCVHQYRPGERLIQQGEKGRDLFLILAGEAAIRYKAGSATATADVTRVGPGTVIGEGALLSDGVRSATAEAVTPIFVFRLAYDDVGYLLQHNRELVEHLRTLARSRSPR
jgi:CRP/FNR family cyclic AMP-dependent transcriptional regulator